MPQIWQSTVLWRPHNPESAPIAIYRNHVNKKFGQSLRNSQQLHKWTIENRHAFWIDLWDYVGMVPRLPSVVTKAYDDSQPIQEVPLWFEGVRLNYAENVLMGRNPNGIALIGLREGQPLNAGEQWTWAELTENVRRTRSALLRNGIKQGDRVAALMSNSIWTIALFLAAASIGAIFTSISPELGLEGCVSRLNPVEPSIFFADSHQTYKGRQTSMLIKITQIAKALSKKPKIVIVPLLEEKSSFTTLATFLSTASAADELVYRRVPFSQPLMILYSSGTSGPPKCITHQHGVIIQLKKIALLHNSLTSQDIVFQYSSTSWVLWNIMNGHLSVGATLICYDGSPLYPDPSTKLRICQHHKVTYFGTSPRYLLELEMSSVKPSDFDLRSLRMVTTTGATLTAEQFLWFYRSFPSQIHLSSVAGGTEIVSSWMASDPAGPVYAGEMQIPALGQDVDVGDPETGESIKHTGEAGELICRTPFPSMPVYFWGDEGNKKYNEAYFERYAHISVWAQHDWIQFNPSTGGAQITGRSDATLNPSGIRFGSAEIYSIIEGPAFNDSIADTICVGRKRPSDQDETVFLFVKMQDRQILSESLRQRIEQHIRKNLSPRHVPRFILQIEDIPVTINGKKVEIAVKRILSGAEVKVSSTVANPESLKEYTKFGNHDERRLSKL